MLLLRSNDSKQCDPEAALSVVSNPLLAAKTTLITLDLTHQLLATPNVLQLMLFGDSSPASKDPSTLRQLLHDLLTFFAATYAEVFGLTTGPPLHDPLAVAVVLCSQPEYKSLLDTQTAERWVIDIITEGKHSDDEEVQGQVGRTVVRKATAEEAGIQLPRSVNVGSFWAVIEECVQSAERLGPLGKGRVFTK